jgi:hypothetical protein
MEKKNDRREDAMQGPLTGEIARMHGDDLREQACRGRQERIALRAAGGERWYQPLLRLWRSDRDA